LSRYLLLALIYTFAIDDLSTFRTVAVFYPALFILILARLERRHPLIRAPQSLPKASL
jgi:hypothetical protein